MATYPATGFIVSTHKTLSTTTADTVTITGYRWLWVWNDDATVNLYFRFDGTTAVSAADGTYRVPPKSAVMIDAFPSGCNRASAATISVVGNGNAYSVEGLD